MRNSLELNLDSNAFNAFKSDFKQIINSTINTMQNKEVEDASITVKFDINLQKAGNPNLDHPDDLSEREMTIPMFKHKITASMKFKSEKSGILGGPDYELVWDRASNSFALRPVKDNQRSLFDSYRYDDEYEPETEEDDS